MDLDVTFALDDDVAGYLGLKFQPGDDVARFALIDLGGTLASAPAGLAAALLQFVGKRPTGDDEPRARQLAVVELVGPDQAIIVGCARIVTDVAGGDVRQVSMSQVVVRHDDAQTNRWIHAWLAMELLRAAAHQRLPHAYAAVGRVTLDALAGIGLVFQRIEPRPTVRLDVVLIRVNALASERRLRLDQRLPKLPATTWPDSLS